jgi:hypothetical protein
MMEYNRNYGCRITDDLCLKGMRAVVLENEKLRLTILVDKGTDIYEFLYKPLDIDLMWRSPFVLQNPAVFVPSTGNEAGTFLDRYEGGWQEVLPNGGPACQYKGITLGQHGEISNIPWKYSILKDSSKEISVKFWVRTYRTAYLLEKTLTLKTGDPTLYIEEILKNEAGEAMELMWGHHPTVGAPFLSEDCIIKTTAKRVIVHPEPMFSTQRLAPGTEHQWPQAVNQQGAVIDLSRVPAPEAKTADMVYLTDFQGQAGYSIINQKLGIGFGMEWDQALFKYLWMWQVCRGGFGYPWYGNTYNMALEPWTSYPTSGLTEAIRNGSALKLAAGQTLETHLAAFVRTA